MQLTVQTVSLVSLVGAVQPVFLSSRSAKKGTEYHSSGEGVCELEGCDNTAGGGRSCLADMDMVESAEEQGCVDHCNEMGDACTGYSFSGMLGGCFVWKSGPLVANGLDSDYGFECTLKTEVDDKLEKMGPGEHTLVDDSPRRKSCLEKFKDDPDFLKACPCDEFDRYLKIVCNEGLQSCSTKWCSEYEHDWKKKFGACASKGCPIMEE